MISSEELAAFSGAVLSAGIPTAHGATAAFAHAEGARAAADADLLALVAARLEEATASHAFRIAPATFGSFVACRLDPAAPVLEALTNLRTTWDPLESTCRHASLSIL